MSKELPILFSTDMVNAILDGRKTVTRRVIIPQPEVFDRAGIPDYTCNKPRYQKGDLLWMKETYCHGLEWDDCKPSEVDPLCGGNDIWYFADGDRPTEGWGKKRSSRFMVKWATRIWLEVLSIRAERLQEIDVDDITAEGLIASSNMDLIAVWIDLWDKLNAKRGYGWETNPWVMRYEFKKIKA